MWSLLGSSIPWFGCPVRFLLCKRDLNQNSYRLLKFVSDLDKFRHWLILFHQQIAISQSLRLKAILVTPCNPLNGTCVVCNGSSISGPRCFVKFWRKRDMCGLCVGVWSVMAAAFQGLSVLSSSDVNVTCEVFVWGCDAKRNERWVHSA